MEHGIFAVKFRPFAFRPPDDRKVIPSSDSSVDSEPNEVGEAEKARKTAAQLGRWGEASKGDSVPCEVRWTEGPTGRTDK